MSEFVVTGKKGSGKNLFACHMIDDYLRKGKPVVTNMDLYLEKFYINHDDFYYYRIPDIPTIDVLESLPVINTSGDDSKNGLIVFDECAIWLNARSFSDKSRSPVLNWLVHSRKKGWDIIYIVQHIDMLDKQIRDGFAEHLVVLKRLDRISIPFLGWFLKRFGIHGTLPKYHLATTYYGSSETDIVVDRTMFNGRSYYSFYDTTQLYNPLSSQVGLSCSLPPRFYNSYSSAYKLKNFFKSLLPSVLLLVFIVLFFYYFSSSLFQAPEKVNFSKTDILSVPVSFIHSSSPSSGRLMFSDGTVKNAIIISEKSGYYLLKVDGNEIFFRYR